MQDAGSGRRPDENLAAATTRRGRQRARITKKLAENCIKNPASITIARAIPGDTGKLRGMGMLVRHDGRLAMMGDEAAAARGGSSGAHRSSRGQPAVDDELL